jgi:hypothetical protein
MSKCTKFGAPTLYGDRMKQTAIYLPTHMLDWLKSQDGTMSEIIRRIIQNAMIDEAWKKHEASNGR